MGRKLKFEAWPDHDRWAFQALFREGGLLDDQGPLAHWRPVSRETMRRQYALWLGWIADAEPEALVLGPADRASPDRLQRWCAVMEDHKPATLLGYVGAVLRLCRVQAPDMDWSAQQSILADLQRATRARGSTRKTGRVLSTDLLFEAGATLVKDNAGPITHPDQAVRIRDGAVVGLLALLPMRRRALSELTLGTSFLAESGQIVVCLSGEMTKNGQPWEAVVPDAARDLLDVYLKLARPALAARGGAEQSALWLGRNGALISTNQFTRAISIRTRKLLGVSITPHLFRDAAATTLARSTPAAARMIKPVLGHSSERIAEGHYIRADTIHAGRQLASVWEKWRDA